MLVEIPQLLNSTQLDAVRSVLSRARFVDGKLSAGKTARKHKNNQELAPDQDCFGALNDVVMTQLVQHPIYLQTALPVKICAPIYARYTEGMGYGGHIDDPIMGPAQMRYRSDISVTIFLNQPAEYEGGDLCIQSERGETKIKLPAGHALLYPSTSYPSVSEVTAGERLVAIAWIQSHIRRADQREILIQLDKVRQQLDKKDTESTRQLLDQSYANLFRMWAEF